MSTECVAVNIKRIEVPALVEMGTESVILNCDYGTETPGPGLVMKWFFNGSSGLVFQWIPPMQPQVIGLLKGKVDLTFRISGRLFNITSFLRFKLLTSQIPNLYFFLSN